MPAFERSLRARLLLRFGIGLALLLLLDALACYYTALHFANLVYDRWLIDSTRSLARALHVADGRVVFDLPHDAVDMFRFDAVDTTYFRISSPAQGLIGGDAGLPELPADGTSDIRVADNRMLGQPIRLVTLRLRPPGSAAAVTVDVAETLRKRATLAREVLLAMAVPQILLAAIAITLSWLSASRGLKPLTDLAAELAARDQESLAPVAEAGRPYEARVLVARINDLLDRIRNALGAQQRFVADAAHQLRTPLAIIALQAERAARASTPEAAQAAHQALQSAVQRAARLAQQLLSLARTGPEAAALEAFATVDLAALARTIGEEWVPVALARDIDFGLSVPETPVMVSGNARMLGELLANLVDNALRYTSRGGTVTVAVEARDGVELIVEDNGPGIPEAERPRIFERFYRVAGAAGDGCGLGLAIVAEIARAHGARVDVGPGRGGRGTRFVVRLERLRAG